MSHYLRNKVHNFDTGDAAFLASLTGEIAASGLDSTYTGQNHILDHVWREYNKLCLELGETGSMISPYDAGLRPTGINLLP